MQRRILILALGNVREERRDDNYPHRPDLYAREVMVSIYELDATFYSLSEDDDNVRTDKPVRERRGWVFERERFDPINLVDVGAVNPEAYNSAIASTIRAFARLENRKLVKRQKRTVHAGAGIYLTPAGYQLAKSIKSESNG